MSNVLWIALLCIAALAVTVGAALWLDGRQVRKDRKSEARRRQRDFDR